MDTKIARGGPGLVPTWLESQGLPEESLRAAVTELGIEIFGALCARAEPATVRVRICSLATRKFTYTMYAELCRYMESFRAGRSERVVVSACVEDAQETGRPAGQLHIQGDDGESLLSSVEKASDPEEDGDQKKHIKKFDCNSCSYSFTSKAALETHLKMHQEMPQRVSRKKKYNCLHCCYSTKKSVMFVRHVRIHTKEKPYKCRVCGKAFSNSSNCHRHMRVHTGERPYTCNVCGKGFSQLTHCQKHMHLHSIDISSVK